MNECKFCGVTLFLKGNKIGSLRIGVMKVSDKIVILCFVINNKLAEVADKGRLENITAENNPFYITVCWDIFHDTGDFAIDKCYCFFGFCIICDNIVCPFMFPKLTGADIVPAVDFFGVADAEIRMSLPCFGKNTAEPCFELNVEGRCP